MIPARAPVISERIETEFRTASGITDGKGHAIAGVVLITAGYSADGKYSHYFVSQVPLKVGDFLLPPGQYLIGWVRGQDSLKVTFYLAQSGKAVGQVEATRNLSITRVESFRIWPPADKAADPVGPFHLQLCPGPECEPWLAIRPESTGFALPLLSKSDARASEIDRDCR